MGVNEHRIWDPKFENNYPSKLKILTPLSSLKKKLENGKLRMTLVICKVYIPDLGFV